MSNYIVVNKVEVNAKLAEKNWKKGNKLIVSTALRSLHWQPKIKDIPPQDQLRPNSYLEDTLN